jgi:hypothetical protein
MHRVTAEPGRHVAADAVVAPAGERDPGHEVLGPADDDIGPERGHLRLDIRPQQRIVLEEGLVADHDVVVVPLQTHLPQRRIAREERRIPAAGDERLHRVAHAA